MSFPFAPGLLGLTTSERGLRTHIKGNMPDLRRAVAFVFVLLTLGACWRSSESLLTASPHSYEEVDPDSVRVFLSLADLDEFEWDGLALIKSEFLIEPELDQDWVQDLQREAGKIGANAILIMGPQDFDSKQRLASAFLGPIRFRVGDVIAVRVHNEEN